MMNRSLKYIGVILYFLLNILNKHQIQSIKCYVCDYCPVVTNISISHENCSFCAVAGANYSVHRICVQRNDKIPINFPLENRNVCTSDLCNGQRIYSNHTYPSKPTMNPLSCFACMNCENSTEEIKLDCGGCLTVNSSGITSKFCGPQCEEVDKVEEISCCSVSFCNGMVKLSTQQSSIISVLIITAISGYIL
ncbi:hypothetical protein KSF78_0000500 [Schistosoma japonicum]|nr:hypothetical protein KSF78_0000500 [Schistosoma japonicum]